MLIIGNKNNQSIHIGKDIKIKLINSQRGYAKIGIDAPKDMTISQDGNKAKDGHSNRGHHCQDETPKQ